MIGPVWEKAMRFELESLISRKVFCVVKTTLKGVNQWVVNGCLGENEISLETVLGRKHD